MVVVGCGCGCTRDDNNGAVTLVVVLSDLRKVLCNFRHNAFLFC
jgi:hypothetical protein